MTLNIFILFTLISLSLALKPEFETRAEAYIERYLHVLIGSNTKILFSEFDPDNKNWTYRRIKSFKQDALVLKNPDVVRPPDNDFTGLGVQEPERFYEDRMENDESDVKIVYPQILLTVDDELLEGFENDLDLMANHLFQYWTGVDLAFRKITNPKIRLNIAGIILPAGLKGTGPYFTSDLIVFRRAHPMANGTLQALTKYFSTEFPRHLVDYDFVVGMTGAHVLGGDKSNRNTVTREIGITNIGQACGEEKSNMLVEGRGIVNMHDAIFFLGRLFGASEDGIDTANSDGLPCPDTKHTYMSKLKRHLATEWSPCSVEAIEKYLKSDEARCLRDKPDVGTPYKKQKLPGQFLNRDQICVDNGYKPPTQEMVNDCELFKCRKCEKKLIFMEDCQPKTLMAVLDGTSCGNDKICLLGSCSVNFLKQQDLQEKDYY